MKRFFKITAVTLVCVMIAAAFASFASADVQKAADTGLPFDLVAPANVTAKWEEGNDSPTTTAITYSLSNEMTTFFKNMDNAHLDDTYAEFISKYDFEEIWMITQVDWAVDDVNDEISGWHCNEYWNGDYGFGYGDDYCIHVGEWDGVDMGIGNAEDTVNSHWVTRGVSPVAFEGNPETGTRGLKDQLRPDQYEYKYGEEDWDGALYIDYTKHTVYFRMRFVVVTRKGDDPDKFYYSDWSNVAAVGKDAEKFEPLTKDDLEAPILTDVHMTDHEFNGHAIIALTLTVPDELAENAARVEAMGGGISIETEGRFKGDTEWKGIQGDWTIRAGEMEFNLASLSREDHVYVKSTDIIELRLRYYCYQPELDDIYSPWSEVTNYQGGDDVLRGDVNEDGEVNNKDVVYLFRSLSSSGVNINRILADFNEDGEVDNKDVVALFRYVSTHTEIRI